MRTFAYPGPEVFGSTYRPGEFVSSGRLANVPPHLLISDVFEFSLTFDTPGTYSYLCLTHADQMPGTVEVLPASATDAPSQAEIDAIKTKLLPLGDDLVFICGHGPMSTIGEERESNPFIA